MDAALASASSRPKPSKCIEKRSSSEQSSLSKTARFGETRFLLTLFEPVKIAAKANLPPLDSWCRLEFTQPIFWYEICTPILSSLYPGLLPESSPREVVIMNSRALDIVPQNKLDTGLQWLLFEGLLAMGALLLIFSATAAIVQKKLDSSSTIQIANAWIPGGPVIQAWHPHMPPGWPQNFRQWLQFQSVAVVNPVGAEIVDQMHTEGNRFSSDSTPLRSTSA